MIIQTEPCQHCGSQQVEAPWTLCRDCRRVYAKTLHRLRHDMMLLQQVSLHAYQLGYLVHMGKDPATIPVYYRTGGWQQLNADGTRHPCPPPEDLPAHIDIKKGNE